MRYLEIAPNQNRGLNWDGVRGVMDIEYNAVYSEHFIEHLTKDQGIEYFKEMFRVMKPGGIIRSVWPPMDFVDFLRTDEDLTNHPFVQQYFRVYIQKHKFAPEGTEHLSPQLQCAEGLLWQGGEHKHLWYKKELKETLVELGYKDVKEMPYMKSGVRDFNNIDTPGQIRMLHSAVVEAAKPWSM